MPLNLKNPVNVLAWLGLAWLGLAKVFWKYPNDQLSVN
jgi:hypothetical protein